MLEKKKSSFEKEYKPEDAASSAGSTEEVSQPKKKLKSDATDQLEHSGYGIKDN